MKVYIKKDENNEYYSSTCCLAYKGFKDKNIEIVSYQDIKEINSFDQGDIVIGHINDVKYALNMFNIELPLISYPQELNDFYGRKIWKDSLLNVKNNYKEKIFIKPVLPFIFNGRVINNDYDFWGCGDASENVEVWCGEYIDIKTEWRCFVRYGKIVDVVKLNGDWENSIKTEFIERVLDEYKSAPSAYAIDFAKLSNGKYVVVSVQEALNMNPLSLNAETYIKLITARWAELTHTVDTFLS